MGTIEKNKLIEDLKEACDIIIIDGTPCELVTDSVILSRIVDSTVIVTAHKETKKDNLQRVIRNIQNVGGHLAGVVVNKMPISVKKYNEKYYYHESTGASASRMEIKEKAYNTLKYNDDKYRNPQVKEEKTDENEENFGNAVALEKLDEIEKRILDLGDDPYIGTDPRYLVLKRQGYKVLILEKNLVFYKIDEDNKKVVVYAVVDQRQDYLNVIRGL